MKIAKREGLRRAEEEAQVLLEMKRVRGQMEN